MKTTNEYNIEIATFNSAGIREMAQLSGATHMRLIARGEGATLYAMPIECGELQVLDTHADPVWEEDEAFAETLEFYGIKERE